MDGPLFYTDVHFSNKFITSLINQGCSSYATVNPATMRRCNGHHSVGNSRNLVRKVGLRNDRYTSRRPSRGLRGEDRWSLVLVSHSVIQVVLCFETLPGSRALARPFSIYKPWESALSDVMMAWETWWCDRGWVPRSHCTAVRYQSTRPVTTILLLRGTPAS